MGGFRWVLGGLAGGAAGVLVWVLIGYCTGYEVGWIAWLIGAVVGTAVRYVAYLDDQEEGLAQGIVAAGIAIGSIIVAKFLVYSLLVSGANADIEELTAMVATDRDGMVSSVANEVAKERINAGQPIEWPPGMTYRDAFRKADYPEDVWQEAEARWDAMGEAEQQERRQQREMLASLVNAVDSSPGFEEFFSPWDFLWLGLAMFTAFKIGTGTYNTD